MNGDCKHLVVGQGANRQSILGLCTCLYDKYSVIESWSIYSSKRYFKHAILLQLGSITLFSIFIIIIIFIPTKLIIVIVTFNDNYVNLILLQWNNSCRRYNSLELAHKSNLYRIVLDQICHISFMIQYCTIFVLTILYKRIHFMLIKLFRCDHIGPSPNGHCLIYIQRHRKVWGFLEGNLAPKIQVNFYIFTVCQYWLGIADPKNIFNRNPFQKLTHLFTHSLTHSLTHLQHLHHSSTKAYFCYPLCSIIPFSTATQAMIYCTHFMLSVQDLGKCNASGGAYYNMLLYSFIFSLLRSVINREQHEKNLYN